MTAELERLRRLEDRVTALLDAPAVAHWCAHRNFSDNAASFVAHAVHEVKRLGGCLLPVCRWHGSQPCDHGYLATPIKEPTS